MNVSAFMPQAFILLLHPNYLDSILNNFTESIEETVKRDLPCSLRGIEGEHLLKYKITFAVPSYLATNTEPSPAPPVTRSDLAVTCNEAEVYRQSQSADNNSKPLPRVTTP